MNIINQSANFILDLLSSVLWNSLIYAALSGLVALILGIILVRRMKKAGSHRRPFQLWQFFIRVSYFFIPLWLMVFGALIGGLWGGHKAINSHVDNATEPVIDHFSLSIPQIQEFLNTAVLPPDSQPRTIVDAYNASRKNQGYVSKAYNSAIIYTALEMSPKMSGDYLDPINRILNINPRELKRADLEVIPSFIKAFISMKMAILYWICLWPFGLFFGGLIIERMLYKWFFKPQRKQSGSRYTSVLQAA